MIDSIQESRQRLFRELAREEGQTYREDATSQEVSEDHKSHGEDSDGDYDDEDSKEEEESQPVLS